MSKTYGDLITLFHLPSTELNPKFVFKRSPKLIPELALKLAGKSHIKPMLKLILKPISERISNLKLDLFTLLHVPITFNSYSS